MVGHIFSGGVVRVVSVVEKAFPSLSFPFLPFPFLSFPFLSPSGGVVRVVSVDGQLVRIYQILQYYYFIIHPKVIEGMLFRFAKFAIWRALSGPILVRNIPNGYYRGSKIKNGRYA